MTPLVYRAGVTRRLEVRGEGLLSQSIPRIDGPLGHTAISKVAQVAFKQVIGSQYGDLLTVRTDRRNIEFPGAVIADGADANDRNPQPDKSLGDDRVVEVGDHAVEIPVQKIRDLRLRVVFHKHAPVARLADEPRHPFDHFAIEAFVQAHHQSNLFHDLLLVRVATLN